jgi:hypothetical protein
LKRALNELEREKGEAYFSPVKSKYFPIAFDENIF